LKFVITFDITDDKIRRKVVNILQEYSYRVQKSVFEGFFSNDAISECIKKCTEAINPKVDSLRFYPLCKNCEKAVKLKGNSHEVEEVDYIII